MAVLTPSQALGIDMLNALRTRLNAGGAGKPATISIYSGAKPARPDTAVTTQTLLATVTCSGDCGTVGLVDSVPTLTFNAITADAEADNGGVAAWGRAKTGETTPVAVVDFDISTVGGSGFGQMNTTNIAAGGPISAPSVVITA